jgi:DNA-binding HxlR family transcriptional regulator
MSDKIRSIPDPNKVIHERARLRILVYLSSLAKSDVGFTDLKTDLSMTAGNLSTQLSTLETVGYIAIKKTFIGKKPFTGIRLTPSGKAALEYYLDEMESLLSALKKGR